MHISGYNIFENNKYIIIQSDQCDFLPVNRKKNHIYTTLGENLADQYNLKISLFLTMYYTNLYIYSMWYEIKISYAYVFLLSKQNYK